MLEALVQGTHDPQVLAELARGRLRAKLPALREALEGRFGAHHGLLVGEMLARIDQLDETIGRLSAEVARVAAPCSPLLGLLVTIPGGEPAHRCLSLRQSCAYYRQPAHSQRTLRAMEVAGLESLPSSVRVSGASPLCGPAFPQVTADRQARS
jgi:transposase